MCWGGGATMPRITLTGSPETRLPPAEIASRRGRGCDFSTMKAFFTRFTPVLFIGLLLLIPALIRRRDLDALILPLFAVLLMVVLSRYYASTWAILFLLGTPSRGSPQDHLGSWAALLAGTVLLVMAAGFYPLNDRTTGYFLINYLAYGLFAALALGYLFADLRHWRRNRRQSAPPLTAPHAPPETP